MLPTSHPSPPAEPPMSSEASAKRSLAANGVGECPAGEARGLKPRELVRRHGAALPRLALAVSLRYSGRQPSLASTTRREGVRAGARKPPCSGSLIKRY